MDSRRGASAEESGLGIKAKDSLSAPTGKANNIYFLLAARGESRDSFAVCLRQRKFYFERASERASGPARRGGGVGRGRKKVGTGRKIPERCSREARRTGAPRRITATTVRFDCRKGKRISYRTQTASAQPGTGERERDADGRNGTRWNGRGRSENGTEKNSGTHLCDHYYPGTLNPCHS